MSFERHDPLPLFMQQRCTDEYDPQPYSEADQRVISRIRDGVKHVGDRLNRQVHGLATSRLGIAVGLRALNAEWGAEFFEVPIEATIDVQVAEELFSGPETVIDVQTHLLAPHAEAKAAHYDAYYEKVMPDWWQDLRPGTKRDLSQFIEAIFLQTENAVAVLTSGPGTDPAIRALFNDEMYAVRALIDGMAGTGRLYNHAVVHAQDRREIASMKEYRDEFNPIGWKVYTPGRSLLREDQYGRSQTWVDGWMLDDHDHGFPFLQEASDLNVKLVCAHKGLSGLADNGTARDIGPAAAAFPDINFVIYHSGYEVAADAEGAYYEGAPDVGVNTLLRGIEQADARHGNVYAELGTSWFCMIRRPREAAHVWGKLLKILGPDNVVWGSDSIWYGAPQPTIDAFRVFQIPDDMCEQFGYSKLTPEIKAKILGKNAARVYGFDLEAAATNYRNDDMAWARAAIADYQANGFTGLY